MKNLLKAITCVIVSAFIFSCSVESTETNQFEETLVVENANVEIFQNPCNNQQPQAKLTNNGTVNVTFEITQIDGVILHTVQNLAPGFGSSYLTFDAGEVIFNVTKNTTGIRDEKVVYFMDDCMNFDLVIDSNNYLTEATPLSQ